MFVKGEWKGVDALVLLNGALELDAAHLSGDLSGEV